MPKKHYDNALKLALTYPTCNINWSLKLSGETNSAYINLACIYVFIVLLL